MNDLKLASHRFDDVDNLLREFFHSEMPEPWPEMKAPAATAAARPVRRFRFLSRRLALAASIVLAFVGYFALARNFPSPSPVREIHGPHIGQTPAAHKRVPTPGGGEAIIIREERSGDRIFLQYQSIKGPKLK